MIASAGLREKGSTMLFRAILIGGLLTAGAWAQNEESTTPERPPLTVDRPSFGNSANVVGDGIVQLESGFLTQSFKDAGSVPLYNFPQRLRVGLSEDFELRLDTNFMSFQGGNSGLDDWAPGFKYNFARSDDYKLSILGTLEIPSATNPAFRSSQVNGGLSLIGDFPLDELTYINVNGGVLTPVDALGNRAVQPFGTFYVGRTLSDTSSGYVEFALFGEGPAGYPAVTAVDGGVSFTLSPDCALDFAVFKGLSGVGLDWGGTIGLTNRW
jgi:hypothetical protein